MIAIILVTAVVLYPVSAMPVIRYYSRKNEPIPTGVIAFYRPLFWAVETWLIE